MPSQGFTENTFFTFENTVLLLFLFLSLAVFFFYRKVVSSKNRALRASREKNLITKKALEKEKQLLDQIKIANDIINIKSLSLEHKLPEKEVREYIKSRIGSGELTGYLSNDDKRYISNRALRRHLYTQLVGEEPPSFLDRINIDSDILEPGVNYQLNAEVDPDKAEAYQWRGLAYLLYGFFEFAVLDFSKAISLDPDNPKAWYRRGYSQSWLKKYDEAISDYCKALELDRKNMKTYLRRAKAFIGLKNYEAALRDINIALELDPDNQETISIYEDTVKLMRK